MGNASSSQAPLTHTILIGDGYLDSFAWTQDDAGLATKLTSPRGGGTGGSSSSGGGLGRSLFAPIDTSSNSLPAGSTSTTRKRSGNLDDEKKESSGSSLFFGNAGGGGGSSGSLTSSSSRPLKKGEDLASKIISAMGGSVSVTNIAINEMSLEEMINGMHVDRDYLERREKNNLAICLDPGPMMGQSSSSGRSPRPEIHPIYPNLFKYLEKQSASHHTDHIHGHGGSSKSNKNHFYSLKMIHEIKKDKRFKKAHKQFKIKPIVFISIGAYDLHDNLTYGKPVLVIDALKKLEYREIYSDVIEDILTNQDMNVCLIHAPEPHESLRDGMIGFGREEMLSCLEWTFGQTSKLAEQYGLPMIDLSRSFDPFERKHYGINPLMPSAIEGTSIISDIIAYVILKHDWNKWHESWHAKQGGLKKLKSNPGNRLDDPARRKKFSELSGAMKGCSHVYFGRKGITDKKKCLQGKVNDQKGRDTYFNALSDFTPGFADSDDLGLLADLFEMDGGGGDAGGSGTGGVIPFFGSSGGSRENARSRR